MIMWPFVALQVVGLVLCIAFPEIVLWLQRIAGLTRLTSCQTTILLD